MANPSSGGTMIDDSTNTSPYSQPKFPNHRESMITAMNVGSSDFILIEDLGPKRKISVKEKAEQVVPWFEKTFKRLWTWRTITKRLPIMKWAPKYKTEDAVGDLVAGITVGLTVIPQSLAYSNIADLPAQYGLYSSFLGALMYIFLGSCKDVPMGPTAICSLLTYQAVHGLGPAHAILLAFLSGVIQFFMGVVGLGITIDFISDPVSSGFTSAVALLILSSQVKDILGIRASGATFIEMWRSIGEDIQNTKLWDTVVGLSCIVVLILMRMLSNVQIGSKSDPESRTTFQRVVNKTIWLISTSRNAILVIVGGLIGYFFYESSREPLNLIGPLPPGLPDFRLPAFSTQRGNTTIGFFEMCSEMGSGIVVLPLIGLLENIAICKAFANGQPVDATQELIAIGLCNIGNSMVQAFPCSGSLSRSAVNNSSGVRTPLGGLYTGILVIVALLFFTPWFFYIPNSVLAAIIVAAVVFMIEVRVVRPIYRSKKSDLIPGVATFFFCLVLPLEIGILIGIGLNLVSILYHAARPKISMEIARSRAGVEYLLLTPDRCLIFPSVDYVSTLVTKQSVRRGMPVVVDCSHIYGADFTAAKVIEVLCNDFSRRQQPLFFYNLKPTVVAVFEGVQPKDFIVYYNEDELDNLLLLHAHQVVNKNRELHISKSLNIIHEDLRYETNLNSTETLGQRREINRYVRLQMKCSRTRNTYLLLLALPMPMTEGVERTLVRIFRLHGIAIDSSSGSNINRPEEESIAIPYRRKILTSVRSTPSVIGIGNASNSRVNKHRMNSLAGNGMYRVNLDGRVNMDVTAGHRLSADGVGGVPRLSVDSIPRLSVDGVPTISIENIHRLSVDGNLQRLTPENTPSGRRRLSNLSADAVIDITNESKTKNR